MQAVWAFEGDMQGQAVAYSTAPLEGYQAILAEPPAPFVYGLSQSIGTIERLSTSIILINDGFLDAWIMGKGPSGTDFEGRSLRQLRGRIYRVTPDGKVALTPPLIVSAVDVEVGLVRLSLVADERGILGASAALATVEEWRRASLTTYYADPELANLLGVSAAEVAASFQGAIKPGNTETVPWLHGPATVPLVDVSGDKRWRIAGVVGERHAEDVSLGQGLVLYAEAPRAPASGTDREYPVVLQGAGLKGFLVAFYTPTDAELVYDYDPRNQGAGEVVREILDAHAPAANPYDVTSAERMEKATHRLNRTIAGQYADAATIEEVLGAIGSIAGIEAFLNTVGVLEFVTIPEVPQAVLTLDAADIYPSGNDRVPGATAMLPDAPPAFGSTVGTVSIDWPSYLTALFPLVPDRRVLSAEDEGEVRLEGAWIHPKRASIALSAASDWYAFPTRIVSIPTHVETFAQVKVGEVVSFVVPALPGSERRLGMVRSFEFLPSDETVILHLADLGYEGMIRDGVLDSFLNWIIYETSPGETVEISPSEFYISFSEGYFEEEEVYKRTVWVLDSAHPENNRSYVIQGLHDEKTLAVEPSPAWADSGTIRAVIVRNASADESVEGKIAADVGYRFSR